MSLNSSTLRPGRLVSLKTSIKGGVEYSTTTLEAAHITKDGLQKARWETERTMLDPDEHELAKRARNAIRTAIVRPCAASDFGLLCPESKVDELEDAIAKARQIARDFNATAQYTMVSVYVMTGKIASDDLEAVRAINSEVRELLARMEAGVKNLDATEIRNAVSKANGIGAMLSPVAAERVKVAIEAARKAARQIVKAGETAATKVDLEAIKRITESRLAFLDMDDAPDVQAPDEEGRAVDFEPEADVELRMERQAAADLEF